MARPHWHQLLTQTSVVKTIKTKTKTFFPLVLLFRKIIKIESIMKLLIALSIICMSIAGMQTETVKTYGDILNYDYLGVEISFITPEPDAVVIDSVTFPEVTKPKAISKELFCFLFS